MDAKNSSTPGTLLRSGWVTYVLAITLVMNLMDLLLTLFVVETGLAVEANPIMEAALTLGSVPFGVSKIFLVSLGVYVLWKYRERTLATVGAGVIFSAYALTIGHHLLSLSTIVAQNGLSSILPVV